MSETQVPDGKLIKETSVNLSVLRYGNDKSPGNMSLEDLKAMFKPSIEEEIVEMIWQDSNGKSEVAFSFLSEMCPSPPRQKTSPPAAKAPSSWSNIVAEAAKQPVTLKSVRPKAKPFQQKQNRCVIVDTIRNRVRKRERILVIMRGVPGSGKSTLAKKIQGNGVVLSTDDYFVNKFGEYYFDPQSLPKAHDWNQQRADREMKASTNPILIDNTNLEVWEMQPYVCMALRYKYSIELVEPDTPWKNDARTLSQKNTHGVPRKKIEQMLEKQRIPIDIASVIESCRQKMNMTFKPPLNTCSHSPGAPPNDLDLCQEPQSPMDTLSASIGVISTSTVTQPPPSVTSSADSPLSKENFNSEIASGDLIIASGTDLAKSSLDDKPGKIEDYTLPPSMDATIIEALRPVKTERSLDEASTGDNESIDSGSDTFQSKRKGLAVLKSYFPVLDTDDLADILEQCKCDVTWAINVLLDSGYECADVVLDTCDLLEENEETLMEQVSPEDACQTLSEASSDFLAREESEKSSQHSSTEASGLTEDTEALRRHIQDCFQLTDTISERARRVCGKDYTEFRASQLSKIRHGIPTSESNQLGLTAGPYFEYAMPPVEMVSSLEAPLASDMESNSTDSQYNLFATGPIDYQLFDESYQMPMYSNGQLVEAMFPITVDSSFAQQLVNLFGPPAGRSESVPQNRPVTFDIPWSIAEQLHYFWCSSVAKDESEEAAAEETQNYTEESGNRQLENVMDIEYAMKLVEEEKNAELRQLRDSLSTKLSRNMLEENYPQVDRLALEALFEANNYNYAHTVAALNASLGTAPKANEPMEIKSPSKLKPKPKESTAEEREENAGYSDIRSEAFMYNQLRQQYAAKARENHSRGMSAVAAYYASESRRYAALYKECNQRAALQIVEKKNAGHDERTIDLHELHVAEALSCLESFIVSNRTDGRTVVHVITGRGNNSVNGRPKIKPAVVTFLNQKKYVFEEVNPGMLRVFTRRIAR